MENPLVNKVAFEGNHKLSDDQLRPEVQLKPRAVYTPALAEADRRKILDAYAQHGYYDASVTPQLIRLPQNRVDVVYQINDGPSTLISKIAFVGNHAFSEDRLSDVINSREERWWRFLSSADEYNAERLAYDKELLRRFYLKNGYTDFEVTNASAELSPDRKSFFVTFTVHEGDRYRVGKININSQLRNLPGDALRRDLKLQAGDWYDGDAVGRSADAIEDDVRSRGYAFVDVKPRVEPDRKNHTVTLTFDVGEGPRVYIERIDIVGNTRTEDKVIRRQFTLAEGDPFSAEAIRKTRTATQRPRLFRLGGHHPQPGFRAGQGHPHHQGDGEGDRRADLRRRVFDRRRSAAGCRAGRAQPGRQRHLRQHQRHPRGEAKLDRSLGDRSVFPRSQPGGRRRRLPDPDRLSRHRAV